MSKTAIIISPNWGTYAEKYLEDLLVSFVAQRYSGELKFFLVDNETSEASRALVNGICTKILAGFSWMLLTNVDNAGFAKGNNVAMQQAIREGYDYLALFNMDGLVAPDCLTKAITVLEQDEQIGAVQPRLMLWPDTQRINSLGNVTHFLGFGYCEGNGELWQDKQENLKNIAYPSGAAVIFRASALVKVGLFDEKFWMYNEDQDLGWRLWLAGYRCVSALDAVFYHKYQFAKSIKHFYWQDRNRLLAVLKNYNFLTILVLLPAYLVSELGLWLTAIRGGWFISRLKVYGYFLLPTTWFYLLGARGESQKLRQVQDQEIIKLFSGKILYQELDSPVVRLGNLILNTYWQIAKLIIRW